MPTSIAWTVEPLVEAEAVVEAEWIRILEEQSADPNDAITRERPALRRVPIGTAVAAATDPRRASVSRRAGARWHQDNEGRRACGLPRDRLRTPGATVFLNVSGLSGR